MAGYMLDTHIVLWAALEPNRLSAKVTTLLESDSVLFFSAASAWEIAIKHSKGALTLKSNCECFVELCIEKLRLSVLPIQWRDCVKAACLPKYHLDPFDRMIIQQAKDRSVPVLTVDPEFSQYGIKVIS